MADVFISYHTKSAKNIADRLCSELESRGISCWYAPRDVDPGAYKSSIAAAIRNCKIFLLLLNPEADKSEQVKDEVHLARHIYDKNQEAITILPVRLNHYQLSDEMYMEISRFHMFEISNESGTPGELMELVKASLGVAQDKQVKQEPDTQKKDREKNQDTVAETSDEIEKSSHLNTKLLLNLLIAFLLGVTAFIFRNFLIQIATIFVLGVFIVRLIIGRY